jgi:hypothetical protein
MAAMPAVNLKSFIGREPERLSLDERHAVAGKWIAIELYSPKTLPLRRIEAMGDSVKECIDQLASRGLDPRRFEFEVMRPPY